MATFLMLSRSRGAIGRVRATPGALSMAGRTTDGPDGRTDGIPGVGKGLRLQSAYQSRRRSFFARAMLREFGQQEGEGWICP